MPLGLVLLGAGCDKATTGTDPPEEICDYQLTEIDPAILIIGRWELSKNDNRNVEQEEVIYWEFGPDSSATWQMI